MNQHQSDLRRSAAKAFQESLEQLGDLLESENAKAAENSKGDRPCAKPDIPPAEWEEAGQDLEEFFGNDAFAEEDSQ